MTTGQLFLIVAAFVSLFIATQVFVLRWIFRINRILYTLEQIEAHSGELVQIERSRESRINRRVA
jgi:hypothetical protein